MELLARRRRREAPLRADDSEPERKRICKTLETLTHESEMSHQLNECAMEYWTMELDLKQKGSIEPLIPQATKEKQNSLIFQNHENKGSAQPCPRCMAGESGHFNHIMSL